MDEAFVRFDEMLELTWLLQNAINGALLQKIDSPKIDSKVR